MGGPSQTTTAGPPTIPPYLLPVLAQSESELFNAMVGGVPSLSALYTGVPQLGVPQLTGQQQQDIGAIQGLGQTGGAFPYEQQAAATMGQIADPTTAKAAFEQFAVPATMQQATLAGQGTSGAADYAVSQAAIPYELQAQQMQLGAAQGQAALGQQQVANQMMQLQNALTAAGLPYEVAQQMAQSEFNRQQQQWGLAKDIQTFPFSLYGPTIGGGTTNVSTGGKF